MSSLRAPSARRSGGAEERRKRILGRVPAGCVRHDRLEALGPDGHERRSARGEHPLVGVGRDDVERRRVEREPANGLRRVHHGHHVVRASGGCDLGEVGDLARCHLHGAERDDVDVRPDFADELGRRDEPDAHAAVLLSHEREEDGREVDVRSEDAGAVGDRRRDHAEQRRDVGRDRDVLDGNSDEPGERPPSLLTGDSPVLPARPSVAPVLERGLERVPCRRRRKPVRRGVQIRAGGAPARLRRRDVHRGSLTGRSYTRARGGDGARDSVGRRDGEGDRELPGLR